MPLGRSLAQGSGQGIIKNGWITATLEDKNFCAIDTNAGSPFYGRHYTCWDRSNNEKLAYSTNSGSTWTEVDLPTAGGGIDLGCDIAVQKNGTDSGLTSGSTWYYRVTAVDTSNNESAVSATVSATAN